MGSAVGAKLDGIAVGEAEEDSGGAEDDAEEDVEETGEDPSDLPGLARSTVIQALSASMRAHPVERGTTMRVNLVIFIGSFLKTRLADQVEEAYAGSAE